MISGVFFDRRREEFGSRSAVSGKRLEGLALGNWKYRNFARNKPGTLGISLLYVDNRGRFGRCASRNVVASV